MGTGKLNKNKRIKLIRRVEGTLLQSEALSEEQAEALRREHAPEMGGDDRKSLRLTSFNRSVACRVNL